MNKPSSALPKIAIVTYVLALLLLPIQAQWGPAYLYWVLLAGPLLFVPWGLGLLTQSWPTQQLLFRKLVPFAGLIFAASFCFPPGVLAGGLVVIWLLVIMWIAIWMLKMEKKIPLAGLLAILFLGVAGAWALADRLGWQPLGFDPLIVLLTAIHFHYAGFALALVTALLPKSKYQSWLSKLLLAGVGGVALGITSTQLAGPAWIEITAVSTMVAIGWGAAALQAYESRKVQGLASRILLVMGSVALFGGLLLALLYGWRFQHQWAFLTIPWMYATHGILNSVGFTLLTFLGWTMEKRNTPL